MIDNDYNSDNKCQYFDPTAIALLSSLELRARMIVEGIMSGMHRSPYHGFSVEFAQHRQYAPGDDIRHLDWKVYGKTDRLYLKQYHQETNLDLIIIVDATESMGYAGNGQILQAKHNKNWSKYDYAATLSAAMSYLSLKQQDRVAISIFSRNHTRQLTGLSNKQGHWKVLVTQLEKTRNMLRENINSSLKSNKNDKFRINDEDRIQNNIDHILLNVNRRSLVVLVSDLFMNLDLLRDVMAKLSHHGHDLIILQTVDRDEIEWPMRNGMNLIDLERNNRWMVDPKSLRQAYVNAMQEHYENAINTAREFGFDILRILTDEMFVGPLRHFLAKRQLNAKRGGRR